jgi:hypothetical protein
MFALIERKSGERGVPDGCRENSSGVGKKLPHGGRTMGQKRNGKII